MGAALSELVRELLGNIFLAAAGAAALVFLFRREFVRFAEFAAMAVLVATFVYFPEVWVDIAGSVAETIGAGTGATG